MASTTRKRVLITGASSGVGTAAAASFARAGYDVGLVARSRDGLEAAAASAREHGARAVVAPADVTDREALQEAFETIRTELGELDVVVLNAAITIFGPFKDVPAEDFDRVIDVTFTGAVNCARLGLPSLERTGGVLLSVGSLNSRVPLPAWSSYAAAKHAERGFLNTLGVELKASGSKVRVAQLHPGPINTPVWEQTATAVGHLPRRPPDGYPPEQIADALVTLAEDPRKEVLFGFEAFGIDRLWSTVRPVGDTVMGMVYRYFLSGSRESQGDLDALREAVGKGVANDGLLQRPSITAAARGLASMAGTTVRLPRR